jgi:hypothetical protein
MTQRPKLRHCLWTGKTKPEGRMKGNRLAHLFLLCSYADYPESRPLPGPPNH